MMEKCRILSTAFPAFVETVPWFLSFITVMYSVN